MNSKVSISKNSPSLRLRAWFIITGWFVLMPVNPLALAQENAQTQAQEQSQAPVSTQAQASEEDAAPEQTMYIQEYRVVGARQLTRREIEKAVYPFLGPERRPEDVDQARAALEKAFHDKGYQTVSVVIPQQKVKRGVVFLQVTEAVVGRLRVHGSRYYDINKIKRRAPSLAEGNVPNFNEVSRDIVALNQSADLRVTPSLRPGVIPGTVDIDLNVQDTLPLHGNLEINNRYSSNTTPWRINGGVSYNNLWQLGHSLGLSFQIAPERLEDAEIYSAYYMLRVPGHEHISLILQGTKQNSDISTLGGAAVAGRGETIGLRANVMLSSKDPGFYHSLSFGIDYKNFEEDLHVAGDVISSPVTYYPVSLNYSATWAGKKRTTSLNAGVNLGIREAGGDSSEFNNKRYNADDGFAYFRADLSHLEKFKGGFEAFVKAQGQIASGPLINNEQFSGGGLSTVRGYLESTALGDNGIFGTLELRSPSLINSTEENGNEWRFYIFAEGGQLTLNDPLPGQETEYTLASVGAGSRFRLFNHFNGSVDAGVPLIKQSVTDVGEVLFTIRFWTEF